MSVLSSTFVNVFSRETGERKGRRIEERREREGEKSGEGREVGEGEKKKKEEGR